MALFTALISEEKTIVLVCDEEYDLISITQVMNDLMYPFEWCLPKIPYLIMHDNNSTEMLEVLSGIQAVILGVHVDNWESVKLKLLECSEEEHENTVIIALSETLLSEIQNGNQDSNSTLVSDLDSLRSSEASDFRFSSGQNSIASSSGASVLGTDSKYDEIRSNGFSLINNDRNALEKDTNIEEIFLNIRGITKKEEG